MSFIARCLLSLVLIAFLVVFITIVDANLFHRAPIEEGTPFFGTYALLRTTLAFAASLLVVSCIYSNRDNSCAFETGQTPATTVEFVTASAVIVSTLSAMVLAHLDVTLFDKLAKEDSVIEWSSAFFLFAGAVMLVSAIMVSTTLSRKGGYVIGLSYAALLFLIGMEEVSWFQRVWGITTPEWLAHTNAQGELNFHNLATNPIENAYYMGAFIFLVLIPFVAHSAPNWPPLAKFSDFIPTRFLVIVGAMTTTLNYGMWNIFWFQLSVFLSLSILVCFATSAFKGKKPGEAGLFIVASIVLVVVTLMDLEIGSRFPRIWADTEYKELFIAIGLAIVALVATRNILRRLGHIVQA